MYIHVSLLLIYQPELLRLIRLNYNLNAIFKKRNTCNNHIISHSLLKVKEKPSARKISQSIKSAIGTNKGANSSAANRHVNFVQDYADDDLEMADQARKANKFVVDDSALKDFIGKSKKETAADCVDKLSRYFFPVLFITFNVAYWVFFTLLG